MENTMVVISKEKVISFEDWLRAAGKSDKTLEAYLQDVKAFGVYFGEVNGCPFSAEMLTGVDLRGFREWSIGHGVAPATWNRRRATLGQLCRWAQETGVVSYNPFQGVETFEEEEQAPRWLDEGEYRRLMRAVEQTVMQAKTEAGKRQALRDQAMVGLMVWAGLREGEVCALDVEDVELTDRRGRVTVRRGKGDKRREIPLNNECRRALKAWLEIASPVGCLFTGKGGERITTSGIQKRVGELGTAAKLEKLTPHQLRHTFAKRLLDSGSPLTVVSKLLGHARLETTARYVQPGWGDFEKAVEKI